MVSQEITPEKNATLGLIFRLNALWAETDIHAKSGDYDSWNNVLDRIYYNLLYRESVVVKKDTNGKIISIDLSDKDKQEYDFLTNQISKYKIYHFRSKGFYKPGVPNKKVARTMWFKAISLKDIWLRKLMNELNLYIRETVSDPGRASGW